MQCDTFSERELQIRQSIFDAFHHESSDKGLEKMYRATVLLMTIPEKEILTLAPMWTQAEFIEQAIDNAIDLDRLSKKAEAIDIKNRLIQMDKENVMKILELYKKRYPKIASELFN